MNITLLFAVDKMQKKREKTPHKKRKKFPKQKLIIRRYFIKQSQHATKSIIKICFIHTDSISCHFLRNEKFGWAHYVKSMKQNFSKHKREKYYSLRASDVWTIHAFSYFHGNATASYIRYYIWNREHVAYI